MKKRLVILLCVATLFLSVLGGCGQETANSKADEKKVVVYFLKNHPFYEEALSSFQKKKSGIQLELRGFESEEDLAQQFSAEGFSSNTADLMLLSNETQIDIEKVVQEDSFLDLTTYLQNDPTFKKADYFESVLQAGEYEEKQYVIPLSFDLGVVTARSSVYEMCNANNLQDSNFYTFSDEVLGYQKQMYDSEDVRLGINFPYIEAESNLLYAYHMSGIQLVDGNEVSIDANSLQALCDFVKAGQNELMAKLDEIKNSGSNSATMVGYIFTYGNPASAIRRQEYNYEVTTGDTTISYGIPGETSGKYHATIRDYGVINAKTVVSQEAFQVLRYLMDYDYYGLGVGFDTGAPVNAHVFNSQLEEMKNLKQISLGNTMRNISEMSEDNYNMVTYMIENIDSASLINPKIESIFVETMGKYISGAETFEKCFQQLTGRLELYLKE